MGYENSLVQLATVVVVSTPNLAIPSAPSEVQKITCASFSWRQRCGRTDSVLNCHWHSDRKLVWATNATPGTA